MHVDTWKNHDNTGNDSQVTDTKVFGIFERILLYVTRENVASGRVILSSLE